MIIFLSEHPLRPDEETSTQQMNHVLNLKLRQQTHSVVTEPCLDICASYFEWKNNTVLVYKHFFIFKKIQYWFLLLLVVF